MSPITPQKNSLSKPENKSKTQPVPDRKLTLTEVVALLVADGMIAAEEAGKLIATRRNIRAEQHPLVIIGEQKWRNLVGNNKTLLLEPLTEWLAGKVGLPYFHIDPLKVDFSMVATVMSNEYAKRLKILPVSVSSNDIWIATSEPYQTRWAVDLAQVLKREIKLVLANPLDINRYLTEFYNLAKSVSRAVENKTGDVSKIGNFEQLVELGKSGKLDANESHIINIFDWLLQYAFEQGASDIHLEPRREMGMVRFRIDGVLHQVYQIPVAIMVAITSRIKLLGRMDVIEKRRPQDGRIKTKMADRGEVELRLSTMPTAFGEKIVMRIFEPDVLVKDFIELGFPDEEAARWRQMIEKPNGIILVTGPTGSGKTTTLYSTLKMLAKPEVNVCTIEDPIEMIEPAFNQMQVQSNIGLDFATGVRTLMRQDPDIIMIGEIRDLETAEMAIQSALTGHLVLSTLHTNDAPSAVTRLLDLGVVPYLIQSTLLGVLAQRLIRTLCPHCKEPGEIDNATWNMLVAPWKAIKPKIVQQAVGCLECHLTGYRGRVGIYEVLTMTPTLRKIISADYNLDAMREQAQRDGMKALRISGAMKIAAGITTPEEIFKIAPPVSG